MTYKKKLIEVAIPLEAINAASLHEKSIRQGHPSSLHQWWARRPLAACRAVLFAQMVDDPSSNPDRFPTEDSQKAERERLFEIIRRLVSWDNFSDKKLLESAFNEIEDSCAGVIPKIYDPFSGAASIPLEAQRLGLPSYGSDLNPVAVMIGKALLEYPQAFADHSPMNPDFTGNIMEKSLWSGSGAQGIAEDVRYYGDLVRKRAFDKIGYMYPEVKLPEELGGKRAKVIAWIWARTVKSPNPAFADVEVPLVKSFLLSTKNDKTTWVNYKIDKANKTYSFYVSPDRPALEETVGRTSAVCLMSGDAIPLSYIQDEGKAGRIGTKLMAVVADGPKGRVYLSATREDEDLAARCVSPEFEGAKIDHWRSCTNCVVYGLTNFRALFTPRQATVLNVLADEIVKIRDQVISDAHTSRLLNEEEMTAYANALAVYMTFALDKLADLNNSLCRWEPKAQCPRNMFGKQAIPMVWDFAESNPFSSSSGSWNIVIRGIAKALESSLAFVNTRSKSKIYHSEAQEFLDVGPNVVFCTDPPYYDNIPYSNLSDFFYIWMKRTLGKIYPEIFNTVVVPRSSELVANQFRHGGKDNAESFFLDGMKAVMERMVRNSSDDFPTTIFYAFKQSEVSASGVSSKGWATFLEAVISSGFSVVGTWPIRTENSSRMMGQGNNALANSVVLVCRKKKTTADTVTRSELIRTLTGC